MPGYFDRMAERPKETIGPDTKPGYNYALQNEELSGDMEPYFEPGDIPVGGILKKGLGALGGIAAGSLGIPKGYMQKIARDLIKYKPTIGGPWFHGSHNADKIIKSGNFEPAFSSRQVTPHLGEPHGVSLSSNPESAWQYGNLIRTGVDVDPARILQMTEERGQHTLRKFFDESMRLSNYPRPTNIAEYEGTPNEVINHSNRILSDLLRNAGWEGVKWNPNRFNDHELRMLNPDALFPFGQVPMHGPRSNVMERYMQRQEPKFQSALDKAASIPSHLTEILGYR